VSSRVCTCIPYWRALSCGRCRGSSATPFQFIFIGDRAFPVAAARVWNSLPDLVTSAPSVALFWSRLKTHPFNISYPSPLWLYSAWAMTLSCFGHYNRSCLLPYLKYVPTLPCSILMSEKEHSVLWQIMRKWERPSPFSHCGEVITLDRTMLMCWELVMKSDQGGWKIISEICIRSWTGWFVQCLHVVSKHTLATLTVIFCVSWFTLILSLQWSLSSASSQDRPKLSLWEFSQFTWLT